MTSHLQCNGTESVCFTPLLCVCLQEATIFELPGDTGMPETLGSGEQIQFPEAAYSLEPGSQGDYSSPVLRLSYTSLTTPASVIDVNMKTRKRYFYIQTHSHLT